MHVRCLLDRPRLLALVREAAACPLTVVAATAGYGKTTALRASLKKTDAPQAWVSLTGGDINLFWEKFCAAVGQLSSEAGAELAALGTPADERQRYSAVTTLTACAATLAAGTSPALLVVDDFHLMGTAPMLCRMFLDFVLEEPEGLHIVLLTRREPDLPLATLAAKGLCCVLRTQDLAFSEEEIRDYFSLQGLAPDAAWIHRLREDTDGWISAIALIDIGHDTGTFHERKNFYSLLRENLFDELEPAWQDALCRLSVLDAFTPAQAEQVLAHPGLAVLLEKMVQNNAFISVGTDGQCSFHPLLRYFLEEECRRRSMDLRDTRRQAALWYETRGDLQTASRLFWEAGALEELLARANAVRHSYVPYSSMDILCGLAERLPAAAFCRYPFAALYIILLLRLSGGSAQQRLTDALLAALRAHAATSPFAENDRILGECCIIDYFCESDGAAAQKALLDAADLLHGEPSLLLHSGQLFTFGLPGFLYQEFHQAGTLEETLLRTDAVPFEKLCPGFGHGSNRLARAEAALERGDPGQAELLARQSLIMALGAQQFQVAAGAFFVLLRRALLLGDAAGARRCLDSVRAMEQQVRSTRFCPINRRLFMDITDLMEGWLITGAGLSWMLPESLAPDRPGGQRHSWMMNGMGLPVLVKARAALQAGDFAGLEVLAEACRVETAGHWQLGALHAAVLLAVARWQLHDRKNALSLLDEALISAAADGVLLPFMDYAPHLVPLLEASDGRHAAFRERILAACRQAASRRMQRIQDVSLTARELDILRQTENGLTRKEIAQHSTAYRKIPCTSIWRPYTASWASAIRPWP